MGPVVCQLGSSVVTSQTSAVGNTHKHTAVQDLFKKQGLLSFSGLVYSFDCLDLVGFGLDLFLL